MTEKYKNGTPFPYGRQAMMGANYNPLRNKKVRVYASKKMENRIQAIDNEINEVKREIKNTYNVNKQIKLSECLVMLYKLKKQALGLK